DDDAALYLLEEGLLKTHKEWLKDRMLWIHPKLQGFLMTLFYSLKPSSDRNEHDNNTWYTRMMGHFNYVGSDERMWLLWMGTMLLDPYYLNEANDGISDKETKQWEQWQVAVGE